MVFRFRAFVSGLVCFFGFGVVGVLGGSYNRHELPYCLYVLETGSDVNVDVEDDAFSLKGL
jgi:hypothetical protein